MHDDTDDTCRTQRLIDENNQLREENRSLRDDMEHLIHQLEALRGDK